MSYFCPIFAIKIRTMDNHFTSIQHTAIITTALREWSDEQCVLDYGAIILCTCGDAEITINFTAWQLYAGAVITVFPNDAVKISAASADFLTISLCYDATMLREASLQIESAVYDKLREDRCRTDSPILTDIVGTMLRLVRLHHDNAGESAFRQIVLLQLKAFFLGFYDYIYHHPVHRPEALGPQRAHELFQRFMVLLEHHYVECHDVAYYADSLDITPKYLNTIVHHATGCSTKEVIDHYLVLQLKLLLRSTQMSIKEIAWKYHFSNVSFFDRYFKKHTGMTPKQYKQNALR